MVYSLEHPQWLGNLFNGRPYLKRTASQNSTFDKLDPSRLIDSIVNQLEGPCSCDLVRFSCKTFFLVIRWSCFTYSPLASFGWWSTVFDFIFRYCLCVFLLHYCILSIYLLTHVNLSTDHWHYQWTEWIWWLPYHLVYMEELLISEVHLIFVNHRITQVLVSPW